MPLKVQFEKLTGQRPTRKWPLALSEGWNAHNAHSGHDIRSMQLYRARYVPKSKAVCGGGIIDHTEVTSFHMRATGYNILQDRLMIICCRLWKSRLDPKIAVCMPHI